MTRVLSRCSSTHPVDMLVDLTFCSCCCLNNGVAVNLAGPVATSLGSWKTTVKYPRSGESGARRCGPANSCSGPGTVPRTVPGTWDGSGDMVRFGGPFLGMWDGSDDRSWEHGTIWWIGPGDMGRFRGPFLGTWDFPRTVPTRDRATRGYAVSTLPIAGSPGTDLWAVFSVEGLCFFFCSRAGAY